MSILLARDWDERCLGVIIKMKPVRPRLSDLEASEPDNYSCIKSASHRIKAYRNVEFIRPFRFSISCFLFSFIFVNYSRCLLTLNYVNSEQIMYRSLGSL